MMLVITRRNIGLGRIVKHAVRLSHNDALSWLHEQGYDQDTAQGIVNAFTSAPSLKEVQAIGEDGLKSLAKAVQQDLSKFANSSIVKVIVNVPSQHRHIEVLGREGETLYDLSRREPAFASVLECACGGIAACSTCHVYVDKSFRDKLPPPQDSELDMLDLAWGQKKSSRLGCQIKLTKLLDGIMIKIPEQTNNLYN
jgi:ferredoxin